MNLDAIIGSVKKLMDGDDTGHGSDHVMRVYKIAINLAKVEGANQDIVGLAALLHDCDDYKLFGQEVADNLSNSKSIMVKHGIDNNKQDIVLDIISNMGYSKSIKGIRPKSKEGQIVSDADMLDAIGATGTVRTLSYALTRCQKYNTPIFDEKVFPELDLSMEEYKKPDRLSDNFINHYFEKLLRLRDMMFTESAVKEAEIRHKFMVDFLYQFFRENDAFEWIEYLDAFESSYTKRCA